MRKETDLPIKTLEDLVVVNEDGNVAVFDSAEDADIFREDNPVNSRIVELPLY